MPMNAGRGIAAMFPNRRSSTNAFWAGFGTSGSLLAAAAVVFAIAAGVVAFTAWPDAPGSGTSTLRVSDGAGPVFDVPSTIQVASAARVAAAAVTAAPAPTATNGAGLVAGGGQGGGQSTGTSGAGSGGTQVPEPPPAGTPNPLTPITAPITDSAQQALDQAEQSTQTTNNQLGQTLNRISPQLGKLAQDTGAALVGAVDSSARTLLQVLQNPPPRRG